MIGLAGSPAIYFKKIGIENGLSHRKVNCILQDRRGFLWFGTNDGLNRYDGRYMVNYRYLHNDKTCVSGNIISDLYEDTEGILWIATQDGGITRYDYRLPAARQFKQFRHNVHNPAGIPENGINKITSDRFGYLWLGTSSHYAIRVNKKTEKFDFPVKKGTRCAYTLAMSLNDTLLIGRAGGGLLKMNTRTLVSKSDPRYENLYDKLPHVTITSMYRDKSGLFWMGSWDKTVYTLNPQNNKEVNLGQKLRQANIPPDDYISFAEDNYGQIWMAGKNTGLAIYNMRSGIVSHYRHDEFKEGSLSDDHVNAVYRDRDGVMWVATNNGISMFNPLFTPFVQHRLPKAAADIIIYDFHELKDGKLLVGTSNGIYIKAPQSENLKHLPLSYKGQQLAVTKFYMDVDSSLYIGTDYTLFRLNALKKNVQVLAGTESDPVMKKLISSRIVSIIRDTLNGHPVLLVSPYGHYLTYYDLQENKWVSRSDSVRAIVKKYNIKDNLIRKLVRDKRGDMLLATYKTGMGIWAKGRQPIHYLVNDIENKYSLSSNDVFDIQEDYSGNLWISTFGGGVNYFSRNKQKFYHLTESSNLTEGMRLDSKGNLWMLCNGHVHKYDPLSHVYSCYDVPELQPTGGLSGYLFKDHYGTLYAAGINYFVTFRPESISKIKHDPPIYFTDFKIYDRSLNEYLYNKEIKLTYLQNQITIDYAAPEYSGDNLQYAYMLEGFDKDWIVAGKRNSAEYANLKGGTYKFKVRATNWKGTFTDRQSEITIVITPPFWQRTWFYILSILLICGIVYLVYRYRINSILQQQAIRNGIAQDLHDQVGATLSSISVYSEVARKYQENGQESQLSQVLGTISFTANEMVSEMADIVWAINPKNDHLESVFNRIRRYAEPLCAAKEINFVLKYTPGVASGNIGMHTRKNLFLITKEAINNAVKHSGCSNLIVSINGNNELVELVIRDDGIGFNIDDSRNAGNGLNNITSRAEEMKATIEYKTEPGMGTYIRICFK
ncbi:hypothetical protein GCM10023149_25280 [Mucilaginibacter gynuensis]|uniref:Histidine kinase domain-containing protein n=1 Tax=Mucilaginibacter gynuensis TaxID=1302236 RepID=A0ABP8GGH1_9SPHI